MPLAYLWTNSQHGWFSLTSTLLSSPPTSFLIFSLAWDNLLSVFPESDSATGRVGICPSLGLGLGHTSCPSPPLPPLKVRAGRRCGHTSCPGTLLLNGYYCQKRTVRSKGKCWTRRVWENTRGNTFNGCLLGRTRKINGIGEQTKKEQESKSQIRESQIFFLFFFFLLSSLPFMYVPDSGMCYRLVKEAEEPSRVRESQN